MKNPRFQFSSVVVVDGENIGVILKTWGRDGDYSYDVYNRYSGKIKTYPESKIRHFVYSKYLLEDEKDLYVD